MLSLNSQLPYLNMNLSISWSSFLQNHDECHGSHVCKSSLLTCSMFCFPYPSPCVFFPTNLEATCLLILYFREATP